MSNGTIAVLPRARLGGSLAGAVFIMFPRVTDKTSVAFKTRLFAAIGVLALAVCVETGRYLLTGFVAG